MPVVDFGGLETGLANGQYVGVVTGRNYTVDERNDQMLVSFEVNIDGKKHRTKLYQLEGKGVFYLYQALTNMGVDVPKGQVELDSIEVEGLKAEFEQSEKEVNGKKYKNLEPTKPLGKATKGSF
jgi:hypothetical protein